MFFSHRWKKKKKKKRDPKTLARKRKTGGKGGGAFTAVRPIGKRREKERKRD